MLSRRNIRIKVMQILYSMSRDPKLTINDALLRYRESIDHSYLLYLFNLQYFIQIAEYSKKDAERKSAKLLPSEEDKKFTAKLCENELVQSLKDHSGLNQLFQLHKMTEKLDDDNIRLIYTSFAKTDEYKQYIDQTESTQGDHQKILLDLYKHCIANDSFIEMVEDRYPFWADDKSLVIGAMKRSVKALPTSEDFYEVHRPTSETTIDFGEVLFKNVNEENDLLLELIEPTLKNWDVDRVAVIDMVLLKMALCELMNFPTIPTKVTLNEFVEIAKQYSTEKSKDFINGILDRLMKKLHKDGKIVKEGRGLVE